MAGDAALTFDPRDEAAIRAAVQRLLTDPGLREELARRGRAQAARFSWAAAAEATWGVYDRVLATPAPAGVARRIGAHPRIVPATALAAARPHGPQRTRLPGPRAARRRPPRDLRRARPAT